MAYTTITDPSAYFQTLLYTGNSSTQSVTFGGNSDLQPDWVWTKCRSNASDHFVFDSTRGVHKRLFTNTNAAEVTNTNALTSFDSDGFSMGNVGGMNFSSQTYVGWGWKANGGTTSTNTDGSQNSTVQVNSAAGFSIVKRTGTGSAGATYGHGLGAVPDVIINKGLNTNEWYSYFKAIGGGTHWIDLSGTGAAVADANMWNNTDATSSVFTVGNSGGSNGSGVEYINYCFKSVQGFSKFGSYSGNGSTDGTFVYLGFRPAWVIYKCTSHATDGWYIQDSTISPYNVTDAGIRANSTDAEAAGLNIGDMLSNGFKIRIGANNNFNASGRTYLYMAFAQNPFVATNAVPTTAR